ncbi:c-type cytochrome [Vannielia litorea]|uniref:c-type cytochrome n=1 Tax=Vannielia litorea TaxID=1217970 RepID=UPI001BCEB956|nr:cytochrome c [Vannielia litorea]
MTHRRLTAAALLIFAPFAATAHDGVQNPAVKKRMAVMKEIQSGVKVMGEMVKGARPFDPAEAEAAAEVIRAAAPRVVPSFTPEADDPKSEANPLIWSEFSQFEAEAAALERAATGFDGSTPEALKASFTRLGKACRSRHEHYKE